MQLQSAIVVYTQQCTKVQGTSDHADLRWGARDHKVPGNASPVPFPKLRQSHQEQAMFFLSPWNTLAPLRIIPTLQLLLQQEDADGIHGGFTTHSQRSHSSCRCMQIMQQKMRGMLYSHLQQRALPVSALHAMHINLVQTCAGA